MSALTVVGAVLLFSGFALVASSLRRWGRTGSQPQRVGGLALLGAAAAVGGAAMLSGGSTPLYVACGAAALIAGVMMVRRRGEPTERLGRLRRRR
ncbi:MAG TPA: hypothetical protein VMM18_15495 [Gemmatimonadaceae bacterium]|nr:hypothetical protein [Gemmatimonadaceae bacterium]